MSDTLIEIKERKRENPLEFDNLLREFILKTATVWLRKETDVIYLCE